MARILIVDDDRFMRSSLVDTIVESGHEAVAFPSGGDALESLVDESYDVAVVDLKMPRMTGLEFLVRVRERDSRLVVVLITAHGTVETAVQAMKRGAFDYIQKPFGAEELRLLIEKSLEHRRLVGENEALRGELRRESFIRSTPFGKGAPALDSRSLTAEWRPTTERLGS